MYVFSVHTHIGSGYVISSFATFVVFRGDAGSNDNKKALDPRHVTDGTQNALFC